MNKSEVVELMSAPDGGARWGVETDDLNATLLVWAPGQGVGRHVNGERDVVIRLTGLTRA